MSAKTEHWLTRGLRGAVLFLAGASGAALLGMLAVTCLDVALRVAFNAPLKGAVDLVSVTGALTIALALPYTTAIKGHVAVEFFFLKLGRRGRVAVDTLTRLVLVAFFGLLGWQLLQYGNDMRASGQVSQTLQMPLFWVPYVMALCCAVVLAVKIHHIAHPGRTLIQP